MKARNKIPLTDRDEGEEVVWECPTGPMAVGIPVEGEPNGCEDGERHWLILIEDGTVERLIYVDRR